MAFAPLMSLIPYTPIHRLKILHASLCTQPNFNKRKCFKKSTNLSWSVGGKSLEVDKDCKHAL